MTWSIVAKDSETGALGVAVTTKFFAVGAVCPFIESRTGAVATQAFVNPTIGPASLRMMRDGKSVSNIIDLLLAVDEGREQRQVHMIDDAGNVAARTGSECVDWCGHKIGDGFSVAGNMLAGRAVVEDTFDSYKNGATKPFAERLLDALDAGQVAGGDKRGRQSAALKIFTTEQYPWLDLRVDDHTDPLIEMRRLYDLSQREFATFRNFLPTAANPSGDMDRKKLDAAMKKLKDQH